VLRQVKLDGTGVERMLNRCSTGVELEGQLETNYRGNSRRTLLKHSSVVTKKNPLYLGFKATRAFVLHDAKRGFFLNLNGDGHDLD